ncbi:type II toxin-antitoxin system MqsA family antitoxin [Dyella sp. 2RAB6]|uniref:type II toxin-antitoxin system MqsA family antitoxin n=1 Tax=Dyella sp. 2RAB6 TaxID=3232992 RepID=UPI003F8F92DD
MLCDFCDSDSAVALVTTESIPYRNGTLRVEGYESSHCASCGEDFITSEQSRANDRRVLRARAVFDELLTGDQILAIRECLGLSQTEAAEVFGGGPNAFYKYERSEVLVSRAMDLLLRLADSSGDAADWLLQRAGKAKASAAWSTVSQANVVVLNESRRTLRHVTPQDLNVEAANDWYPASGYGEQVAYG